MINNNGGRKVLSNNINGYIIKLYRSLLSDYSSLTYDKFDFITWMNFTGIRVIPVENFSDYKINSFLEVSETKSSQLTINTHFERQKLFIYSRKNFSGDSDSYCESIFEDCSKNASRTVISNYPLISLIIIDFNNRDAATAQQDLISHLKTKDQKIIKWNVFQTLSSSDCITVLRSKSFKSLMTNIIELRNLSFVKSTYTICGIKTNYSIKDLCTEAIPISMRFTLSSNTSFLKFKEDFNRYLEDNPIFKISPSFYATTGKYDVVVEGELMSIDKLIYLFDSSGFLSYSHQLDSKNKLIQMSSTRFKLEFRDWPPLHYDPNFSKLSNQTLLNDLDNTLKSLVDRILEIESDSIKSTLIRLLFRARQDMLANLEPEMQKMPPFLCKFIELSLNMVQHIDSIEHGVNYLNTYFDNHQNVLKIEFENPKSNYRFIGSSIKILNFYQNIVSLLFDKCVNATREGSPFVPFVIADMTTRITVERIFPGEQLLCVIIPIDMLFDIKHVMAWLIHEAGHYCKLGWNADNRNANFCSNLCQSIPSIIENIFLSLPIAQEDPENSRRKFYIGAFEDLKTEFFEFRFCGANSCSCYKSCQEALGENPYRPEEWIKRCQHKHLSSFSNQFIEYFHKEIYHKLIAKRGELLDSTITYNLFIDIWQLVDMIQDAYNESVSDIFMISILNIDNIDDYLDTLTAYFRYSGSNSRLPSNIGRAINICIRACAVCATILNRGSKFGEYESLNVQSFAQNIADNLKSKQEISIYKLLFDFVNVEDGASYSAYIEGAFNLYGFLSMECYPSVLGALQVCPLSDDLDNLRAHYCTLLSQDENFDQSIDFLDQYTTKEGK